MYNRIYLNNDWTFYREDTPEQKETVRLPHTNTELPFNYFDEKLYQFVSVYEKDIAVPEEYTGKVLKLRFEGAAHQSKVYVNDQFAGEHNCGYTEFKVDISALINYGEQNHIKVVLDARESLNVPPFGHVIDYLTYGGLYREVSLEVYEPSYVEDLFIKAGELSVTAQSFTVDATLHLPNPDKSNYKLVFSVFDGPLCVQTFDEMNLSDGFNSFTLYTTDLKIWSPEQPAMYTLKAQLMEGETGLDYYETTFGLRHVEFRKEGLYVNNKKYDIRGLNRHQCYPYVGYAMPKSVQEYEARMLKYDLGLTAVRTSHYPDSQYFLDECDRIGLMVFTEAPGWQHIGDAVWKQQHLTNVKDMVLQNRNHPSIILWGVRINESQDDDDLYRKANEIAHKYDSTRQTSGVRYLQFSHLLEDVYAYNDFSHTGDNAGITAKCKVTPKFNKPYLVSEHNGHMFPTKEYDCEEHRLSQALRHARVLNDALKPDNGVAGAFGWCMADYNTHKDFGSGDKICYHGVMDMFRNPKMAAAVYASQGCEKPVMEVSSSMDIGEFPGGCLGDVYVFTNADYINLYKNNLFVRRFYPDKEDFPYLPHPPIKVDDLIGVLFVEQEGLSESSSNKIKTVVKSYMKSGMAGALTPKNIALLASSMVQDKISVSRFFDLFYKYVGNWGSDATIYKFEAVKNGEVVKEITKAPMNDFFLKVTPNQTELYEGSTYDVAVVNIECVSKEGNRLVYANDPILLSTEGELELIGPKAVPLRGGCAGTYVKTTGKPGTGKLIVESDRAGRTEISFTIKEDKLVNG